MIVYTNGMPSSNNQPLSFKAKEKKNLKKALAEITHKIQMK